ncbi:hypothetical protein L2729_02715 [Shewanella gelidimarina]|uniref:hypothetical protein n=1 Tax=Shewanella gelidimarina TaxID=56813 RepID=UPI00200D50D4|nr:hypothetical protein [Shewanella gelidimarina]MCL1056903.1 hypothetical protein [Shewanella gelidimarina]
MLKRTELFSFGYKFEDLSHSLLDSPRILGAVDLSRLFLPQFIGYFDKAEAMSFSYSPQIAYNTVKIAKKRGP